MSFPFLSRQLLLALFCCLGLARAEGVGKIYLVYCDRFAGAPASLFGHLMLFYSEQSVDDTSFVLNMQEQALSYGASADGQSMLGYIWNGLTGGISGRFQMASFAYKITKYSNQENRDLWFYELALTSEQRRRLVAYTEQQMPKEYPYRFLDDNCAWRISLALEYAVPGLDLNAPGKFWVLPSDILQRLTASPGFVRRVWRIPALRNRFSEGVATQTAQSLDTLEHLLQDPPDSLLAHGSQYSGSLLDLAMLRLDGILSSRSRVSPDVQLRKNALVTLRIHLPASKNSAVAQKNPVGMPQEAHKSSRITLGVAQRALVFGYQPGYHGMEDSPYGLGGQTIELFSVRGSWQQGSLPTLDRAMLLAMASPSPWSFDEHPMTWSFQIGERQQRSGAAQASWMGAGLGFGVTFGDHSGRFRMTAQGIGRAGRRDQEHKEWDGAWDGGGRLDLSLGITSALLVRAEVAKTWNPQGRSWGSVDMGRAAEEWGVSWQCTLWHDWQVRGAFTGQFTQQGEPIFRESALYLDWYY